MGATEKQLVQGLLLWHFHLYSLWVFSATFCLFGLLGFIHLNFFRCCEFLVLKEIKLPISGPSTLVTRSSKTDVTEC